MNNNPEALSKTFKSLLNNTYGLSSTGKTLELDDSLNPISRVMFNNPAAIVFWKDGSMTVVKAHDDNFDPEKGLAMAISQHYLCDVCGLKRYDGVFKKYLPKGKK